MNKELLKVVAFLTTLFLSAYGLAMTRDDILSHVFKLDKILIIQKICKMLP